MNSCSPNPTIFEMSQIDDALRTQRNIVICSKDPDDIHNLPIELLGFLYYFLELI